MPMIDIKTLRYDADRGYQVTDWGVVNTDHISAIIPEAHPNGRGYPTVNRIHLMNGTSILTETPASVIFNRK